MSRNRLAIIVSGLLLLLAALWPLLVHLRRAGLHASDSMPRKAAAFEPDPDDPPEVAIGERMFRESRFAQFFFANRGGNVNAALARGDPVLDRTVATDRALPGPFSGGSMSCRACHLVDEHALPDRGGSRSYADFARRSPVPIRGDGLTITARNSPAAVGAALPRRGFLLHFDGEFTSSADLVRETLLGRNFGWLPGERAEAIRHVVRVIREDDGTAALGRAFGGAYRDVLAGSASVPPGLRLPPGLRVDVERASDDAIVEAVARLIAAYLESLVFHRDAENRFDGSPYDVFLRKNGLPRQPMSGESDSAYSRRLRERLERLERPRFVGPRDGRFRLHDQAFEFGPRELHGLQVFMREASRPPGEGSAPGRGGAGNCVSCHPAPHFTDFGFHNTGAAESEYEAIHGRGAFGGLRVPDLRARNARFDDWLPATHAHPQARGPFRSVPSKSRPGQADLGLWNVLGNPDLPKPQAALRELLCGDRRDCTPTALLALAIARFKTPGLRDLGHSAPYLHTGRAGTLEDVVAHYVEFSARARAGTMRNPDPRLSGIALSGNDLPALAAFLRSLNEDYE